MATPQIINQVEVGLDRMLSQFDNSPKLRGLFESYLVNVQITEDMFQQLLDERDIFSAIGVQLDVIGLLVGELRRARNDEEYREAILNRVVLNSSDGTPPVVLGILKLITGASVVDLFEHFPASIHYFASGGVTNNTTLTMDNASSAGVSVRVMFDEGDNSFIGAGLITEEFLLEVNSLINGGINILGVDNVVNEGQDIGIQKIVAFAAGTRSVLPPFMTQEQKDRLGDYTGPVGDLQNPLCAVL